MTYKILTEDTKKIIYHSNLRSALDPTTCNLCLNPLNDDERIKPIVRSHHDSLAHGEVDTLMQTIQIPSGT